MSTPAYLTFPTIADGQQYLFLNAAAWNSYFNQISITINSSNLPEATDGTGGAVRKAIVTPFLYNTPTYEFVSITADLSYPPICPTQGDFQLLHELVISMAANLVSMQNALINAGIIQFTS